MDDKQKLLAHLQQIIRERDPYIATAGYFFVQEYIRQEFAKYGAVKTQEFNVSGRTHRNFLLDLCPNAAVRKRPPILLGAHYDAVLGCPGADDNGTGLAALLLFAEIFSQQPANYPIRLVAFDLEEYGLQGSLNYATHLRQQGEKLRLMVSLEMLGYCSQKPNSQAYPPGLNYFYPDRGNFIALVGDLQTIPEMWRMGRVIKKSVPCEWLPAGWRGYPVPDARRSDHVAFWEQGYRAMMVTDTANMRNPHYHKPSDTFATLDLDFLAAVCQGLRAAIACL